MACRLSRGLPPRVRKPSTHWTIDACEQANTHANPTQTSPTAGESNDGAKLRPILDFSPDISFCYVKQRGPAL
jgi:hypothetical protein